MEEEEEEEAQGQAQEGPGTRQHILIRELLRGEARCGYVLVETEGIGGEGRWKDSIIYRYKKMRTEEEGGGTSTKEAHEIDDDGEGREDENKETSIDDENEDLSLYKMWAERDFYNEDLYKMWAQRDFH